MSKQTSKAPSRAKGKWRGLFFIYLFALAGLVAYEKPEGDCDYGNPCTASTFPRVLFLSVLVGLLVVLLTSFVVVINHEN